MKKSGATVLVGYWNFIWEECGNRRPEPYTREEYLISLRACLREIEDLSDPETLNFTLFISIVRNYTRAFSLFAVNSYRHLVRRTAAPEGSVRANEYDV